MVLETLPRVAAAINALAVAGGIISAYWWCRGAHPRPRAFVGWVGAGVTAFAVTYLLVPDTTLWAVVTPLREGGTLTNIHTLFGRTPSTGPNFEWLSHVAHRAGTPPLLGIVRLNIALSVACSFFLGAAASYVLGTRWGPFVAVGSCIATPIVAAGATGEQPGPILAVYFYVGAAAVAASDVEVVRRSAVARWAVAITVAAATTLAAATRIETAVMGAAPTLLLVSRAAAGADAVDALCVRTLARIRSFVYRAVSQPWAPAALVASALASWFLPELVRMGLGLPSPHVRSAIRGLNPFDPIALTFPFVISIGTAVGVPVMVIFGLVGTFRKLVATAALPLGFLCLVKVHLASAHDGSAVFEVLRYLVLIAFPTAFVALFGWRELRALVARLAPGVPLRIPAAILVVSLGVFWRGPAKFVTTRADVVTAAFESAPPGGWAGLNVQREVHMLGRAVDERPECVLIAPYAQRAGRSETGDHARFEFAGYVAVRHQDLGGNSIRHVDEQGLAGLLSEWRESCVMYYEGLDCNIHAARVCPPAPPRSELLRSASFPSRQWGEPEEWGPYRGEITLRLYAVHPL